VDVFGLTVLPVVVGVEELPGVNPVPIVPVVVPGEVNVADGAPNVVPVVEVPGPVVVCVGVAASGAIVVGPTKPLTLAEVRAPALPSVPEEAPAPVVLPVKVPPAPPPYPADPGPLIFCRSQSALVAELVSTRLFCIAYPSRPVFCNDNLLCNGGGELSDAQPVQIRTPTTAIK
jgi:hypothetical protein